MNRIFETAAEIGCLGPYLNTLAARRGQSDSAREQWQINRRLGRSIP
jgi:hypothetical protein